MKQEIYINSTPQESRIALIEDGQLAEFLIERKEEMGVAGNIYKGKVARVLPGMQAAFIDIGMEKAGFLHASDFSTEPEDVQLIGSSGDDVEFEEAPKPAPSLNHQDLDLIVRTIRDFFSADTERVVVDSPKDHRRITDFVRNFMPRLKSKIVLYADKVPLFEQQGIEEKVAKALERRVWLRSGGSIVIERTEALTAVDVNTGRFVGKRNQEETIFKTNLEATQEVVRQLRLRNVGGIIIIDFIDMEKEGNRKKVYDALREALKKDKARTNILKISELGLVEMTRQRTRESLENQLLRPCPHCDGRGRIKSAPTIAYDVLRAIKRQHSQVEDGKNIVVRLHPDIANFLYDEKNNSLENLEREINHRIIIKASQDLHQEKYEITEA